MDRGHQQEDLPVLSFDETRQELVDAALEYGRACDASNYPALSMTAEALKSAARRLTWYVDEHVAVPDHVRHKHRKR
jgi:hypothetical protein